MSSKSKICQLVELLKNFNGRNQHFYHLCPMSIQTNPPYKKCKKNHIPAVFLNHYYKILSDPQQLIRSPLPSLHPNSKAYSLLSRDAQAVTHLKQLLLFKCSPLCCILFRQKVFFFFFVSFLI